MLSHAGGYRRHYRACPVTSRAENCYLKSWLTQLCIGVKRLSADAQEPAADSGRLLIDAVNWDVISQQHGTRNPKACRQKWYDSLAPSMVSRGALPLCLGYALASCHAPSTLR